MSGLTLLYGEITEQDIARDLPHYRVRFATGEKSPWMPALTGVSGTSRHNFPMSLGTQVACLYTHLEGVILGALNCSPNPSVSSSDALERTIYKDGTVIEYNADLHALNINCTGSITVTAASHITINAPTTTINTTQTHNGNVSINGNLTVSAMTTTGGLVSQGTVGGGASITGQVNVSGGDVVADGISLKSHTHPGDSGGTTGGPQ